MWNVRLADLRSRPASSIWSANAQQHCAANSLIRSFFFANNPQYKQWPMASCARSIRSINTLAQTWRRRGRNPLPVRPVVLAETARNGRIYAPIPNFGWLLHDINKMRKSFTNGRSYTGRKRCSKDNGSFPWPKKISTHIVKLVQNHNRNDGWREMGGTTTSLGESWR